MCTPTHTHIGYLGFLGQRGLGCELRDHALEGGDPLKEHEILFLERNLAGGVFGEVILRALIVFGLGVKKRKGVELTDDCPRHGGEHVREAAELSLRVEGGDEEGLRLLGVFGSEEPRTVVDDALRRQNDIEVSWSDELHRCEEAGLERCGGL